MDKCEYKNLNYFFNVGYFKDLYFIDKDEKDIDKLKKRNKDADELKKRNRYLKEFIINELMDPIEEKINNKNISTFTMETIYPGLLIGTGNIHGFGGKGEIALGFTFDYVTGVPYIPGSSVKGCLKKAFNHKEYIVETLKGINDKIEYTENDVESFRESIFGSDSKDCKAVSKRDIFFDALLHKDFRDKSVMELDNITPHRQDQKQEQGKKQDSNLLELADPNPITMIKVKPLVKFVFQFLLRESKNGDHVLAVEDKKELFRNILMDLGIGAKTNTGYGYLNAEEENASV